METGKGKGEGNAHRHRVDNQLFIVCPVYNEASGKTIHDLIISLMKKDSAENEGR